MVSLSELAVLGIILGVLLLVVSSFTICICRHRRSHTDTISEHYEDARIYAARENFIPRVNPPRQRRHGRMEVRLEGEAFFLSLPPTYAHVIGHSQDFPHPDPDLLDPLQFELPPPTYQEVIGKLGMDHSVQHI